MRGWTKIKNKILKPTILIFLLLGSVSIFLIGEGFYLQELREGDVALRSTYAPFDFSYQIGIDEIKTQQLREIASERILDLFDFSKVSIPIDSLPEELRDKADSIKLLFEEIYSKRLLSIEDKKNLIKEMKERITVREPERGEEKEFRVLEILTPEEAKEFLEKIATKYLESKKERAMVTDWIIPHLVVNLKSNIEETRRRKKEAEDRVSPQPKEIDIKKGELIISRGERVKKEDLIKLDALRKKAIKREDITSSFGIVLLIFSITIFLIIYLKVYNPKFFSSNRDIIFVSLAILLAAGIAKVIWISPLPSLLIPVASIPMSIILILNNPLVALLASFILSILLGIAMGNNLSMTVIFFIGSIIGMTAIIGARRRLQILRAGLLVGFGHFFLISGFGLFNNFSLDLILKDGLLGMGNGIISSFFLMGILPLFEGLFGYITNISLLELSDFNRPLLKELFLKAPGTYQHGLIVGNLSEAAAEAIGANSLLARVGAYYHDIGKIKSPDFFSENQKELISKHQDLSPSLSRLIILNHVKEGVEIGHKHKLKEKIIDFIKEHHGTSLIHYFYQKALEELEEDVEIREEGFRYPGPKPKTKETAIVLLADSVEAATRALKEPSPERISSVVHRIINNKFIDGQLNDSDLTLRDLERISEEFIHILSGIYHGRIKYPEKSEQNNYKESPKEEDPNIKRRDLKTRQKDS